MKDTLSMYLNALRMVPRGGVQKPPRINMLMESGTFKIPMEL